MRKILLFAMALILAEGKVQAQSAKELQKERRELIKVSKAARNEAKKLTKEGWYTVPDALPLDKQLDKSYMMQMEYDEEMFPKYLMGEAMSIGRDYDTAKMQATELAKQKLAGQIQTEVTTLIENTVANEQLTVEQAESITRSVLESKNLISQNIGHFVTVIEVYRTLQNKHKEVMIRIAYDSDMAKKAAKKAIREDLKKQSDKLHNKLDELLNW